MRANILADQDSETGYDLKGYYNTESRACTNKSLNCEEKTYSRLNNPLNSLRATPTSSTIAPKKIKIRQRSLTSGATR